MIIWPLSRISRPAHPRHLPAGGAPRGGRRLGYAAAAPPVTVAGGTAAAAAAVLDAAPTPPSAPLRPPRDDERRQRGLRRTAARASRRGEPAGTKTRAHNEPPGEATTRQTNRRDEEPAQRGKSRQPRGGKRHRSFWRELPVLLVAALVLAFLVKTFALQAFVIPTGSMQNTLAIGDRVLVNKIVYHLRSIHRGDIVVFDGSASWDAGDAAAEPEPVQQGGQRVRGALRHQRRQLGLHQARDRPARRPRPAAAALASQVTVNGVPLAESSYLYPGEHAVRLAVQHHRPGGPALGDGRSPRHLGRLARPPGAARAAARSPNPA